MEETYDAIVIGGGPGGYVAAIRLAQLGQNTLVVEREAMGGVCLNWGCIPSKSLIAAASLLDKMREAEGMGISVSGIEVNVPQMQEWKRGIVKKLTGGVRSLVQGNGATIVDGEARLIDAQTVEVARDQKVAGRYRATKGIIVGTGAAVIQIPGFEPDGETVITAREAVDLQEAPKSMVIIGGGVIGLELGMVYQKLGTEISVVEMTDQLLPGVDADLVKVVEKRLKRAGAQILLGAKAERCEHHGKSATVVVTHEGQERRLEADKVLVAVGFRPNSKGFGLEELGVEVDARGHILTDDQMRTNVPSIFAIGDVTAPPYLAHKASREGEVAAEVIAGKKAARDWRAMPAAIFTDPEVATAGLSESAAREAGRNVRVGKFPFAASGRAMAVRETDGFFKVVIDAESHEVLGVGIVGPEASDLISEATLSLEMGAYAEDVALTVHAHPTLGEGMMEAFKQALGEAVHVMNAR